MQNDAELNRSFKASLILHVAFMVAPVIYAITAVILDDMRMQPRLDEGLHVLVLVGFAVVSVALFLLRVRFALAGTRTALSQGQSIPESLAAGHVIGAAINETIAVLGLVAYLLTANLGISLAFMGVGLFALYRGRPIKDEWRAVVTKGRR